MAKEDNTYYMTESIGNSGVANTRNPASSRINLDDVDEALYRNLRKRGNAPFLVGPGRNASWRDFVPGVNVGHILNPESKVDNSLTGDILGELEAGRDINDIRHEAQSGWDMLGNSLVNFGVTTASTFISTIGGLAVGIGEAIGYGEANRLWNNSLTNTMADWQNETKKAFTNYRGKEYDDMSLWGKLGSGIFYADLFESLGFTAGMAAGMMMPGVGLGGWISKGVNAAGKLGDTAAKIATTGGKWVNRLISAVGEASTEAVNAKNDEIEGKTAILESEYSRMMSEAISPEERQYLTEQYNKDKQKIQDDAINAGNFTFLSNIAALTASNSIQWGHMLDRGFGTGVRNFKSGMSLLADRTVSAGTKAGYIGKALGRKGIDALSEGLEEVTQSAITDIPKNYTDYNTFNTSIFNPEKRKTAASLISATGQGIAETLGDKNTAEEFASGFLMGIFGAPTIGHGKGKGIGKYIGWENFIGSDIMEAGRQYDRMSELAGEITSKIQDEKKFNAQLNGLVRHLDIQDEKGKAIAAHDHKAYTDSENAEVLNLIMMFEEGGMTDFLKENAKNATELSDAEIQEMIDNTTNAEGTGPYSSDGNKMSVPEARELLQKKAKSFNEMVDYYSKSSEKLREQYPNLNDFARRSILYSKGQLKSHEERIKNVSREASDILQAAEIENSTQKELVNSIRNFGKERAALFKKIDENRILTDDKKAEVKEKLDDLKRLEIDASDLKQRINYLIQHPETSEEQFEKARAEAERQQRESEEAAKTDAEKAAERFLNDAAEAMPEDWDDEYKAGIFQFFNNAQTEAEERGISARQVIQEKVESGEIDVSTNDGVQDILRRMSVLETQRNSTTIEDDSSRQAREEAQGQQRQKESRNIQDIEESSDEATQLVGDNHIDEKTYREELNGRREVKNVAKSIRQDLAAISKLLKGEISDKQFLIMMGYSNKDVKKMSQDEVRNTASTLVGNYQTMQKYGSKAIQQRNAEEEAVRQAEAEKSQRRRTDIEDAAEAKVTALNDNQGATLIAQTPSSKKKLNKGQRYYDSQTGSIVTIEDIHKDGSLTLRTEGQESRNVPRDYKNLYALKSKKTFGTQEEAEDALQKIAEQRTGNDFSKEAYEGTKEKEESPVKESSNVNSEKGRQEESPKQETPSNVEMKDSEKIDLGIEEENTEQPAAQEEKPKEENPDKEKPSNIEVTDSEEIDLGIENETQDIEEEEEDKAVQVDTAQSDNTDQGNREPLSTGNAVRLPGNAMFPYDREKLEAGTLEERQGKNPNDSMSRFFRWFKNSGIQLQKIIDHELSKIIQVSPELHIVRINPQENSTDDAALENYVLLAVPYNDKVRAIHNAEYGGIITSNGKDYLLVGVVGYRKSNQTEADDWKYIERRTGAEASLYFKSNPLERFHVSDKYTEVQSFTSGRQIKVQTDESQAAMRDVNEMLKDPKRNPGDLSSKDLRFGVQTESGFFVTRAASDGHIDYAPKDRASNIGGVFLMIPTASGNYMPCTIKPVALQDLDRSSDNKSLQEVINDIKSKLAGLATLDVAGRRNAIAQLYSTLALTPEGKSILVGDKDHPTISLVTGNSGNRVDLAIPVDIDTNEQSREEFVNTLIDAVWDYNFLFSFKLQNLGNQKILDVYLKAGILRTDYSQLATTGSEFFVYPIGKDGTPFKSAQAQSTATQRQSNSDYSKAQGKLNTVYFQNKPYRKQDSKWYSGESFDEVTDKELIGQLELAATVRGKSVDYQTKKGDYFIIDSSKDNPTIIKRLPDGSFKAGLGETAAQTIEIIEARNKEAERKRKAREATVVPTSVAQEKQKPAPIKEERPLTEQELLDQSEGKFGERRDNTPINEKNKEGRTPAQQEAARIVGEIQRDAGDIHLTKDEKHYEGPGGKLYARVTKIIEAIKGAIPFNDESLWKLPSTKLGTSLDAFVRDFFSDDNHSALGDLSTLSERYRGYTQETLERLMKSLQQFKEEHEDLTFISSGITVTGEVTVKNKDGRDIAIPVAGTLDLLAYDKEGNFHIFDMKTLHGTIDEKKKKKWHNQLSLYKEFLQKAYGIKVVETAIIPFKITYTNPKGWIEQLEDKGRVNPELLHEPTAEYTEEDGKLYADGQEWRSSTASLYQKVPIETQPIRVEYDRLSEDVMEVSRPVNSEKGEYNFQAEQEENTINVTAEAGTQTDSRSLGAVLQNSDYYNAILEIIDELGYDGDYSPQSIEDFIQSGGISSTGIINVEGWMDYLRNCYKR